MFDKILIEKKLRKIEEFIGEINSVEIADFENFQKDIVTKRFIERNIELSIEQMIDICRHFVSRLNLKEPESYGHCFEILSGSNIIPEKNVETYKSMARYRNLLIHIYDDIDDSVTYGILKKRLGDFNKFIADIRHYLSLN